MIIWRLWLVWCSRMAGCGVRRRCRSRSTWFGAIGLAAGGHVTKPTLAVVGESGPEWVIPDAVLQQMSSRSGIAPLAVGAASAPSAGGAGRSAQAGDIVLQIDGTTFALVTAPKMRSALLQQGRNLVNVGLA